MLDLQNADRIKVLFPAPDRLTPTAGEPAYGVLCTGDTPAKA